MMRLVVCLCLCLTVSGCARADDTMPDLLWPEGTDLHPLPRGLRLNGIPVTVLVARMPLEVDDALEHLAGQLDDSLLVRPHRGRWLLSPGPAASWVLSLSADGEAGTVASLSSLPGRAATAEPPQRDWVLAGGALRLDLAHGDASATAFSVHTYAGISAAELSRRLRRRFVERGWTGGERGLIHDWSRAQERLYAVVIARGADSAIVAWHSRGRTAFREEAIAP